MSLRCYIAATAEQNERTQADVIDESQAAAAKIRRLADKLPYHGRNMTIQEMYRSALLLEQLAHRLTKKG